MCIDFVPATLWNLFINLNSVFVNSLEFLHIGSCHLQIKKFHFFLSNMDALYLFFLPNWSIRTSSTMLSSSEQSKCLILFLILVWKLLVFHHWALCCLWDFHKFPLLCWENFFLFLILCVYVFFSHERTSSHAFSAPV